MSRVFILSGGTRADREGAARRLWERGATRLDLLAPVLHAVQYLHGLSDGEAFAATQWESPLPARPGVTPRKLISDLARFLGPEELIRNFLRLLNLMQPNEPVCIIDCEEAGIDPHWLSDLIGGAQMIEPGEV